MDRVSETQLQVGKNSYQSKKIISQNIMYNLNQKVKQCGKFNGIFSLKLSSLQEI